MQHLSYPNLSLFQLLLKGAKERVKKLFLNDVDNSPSSYDTAWVAMVPSPHSPNTPLFPKCINWLLDNQLQDGSWSLPHHNSMLLKDVLSSTLASVLALKTWGIAEQLVQKDRSFLKTFFYMGSSYSFKYYLIAGAQFIELNFSSATDEDLYSPVGFDIIFPGMIDHGRNLNLNLQLQSGTLNTLLLKRDQHLKRCFASNSPKTEAFLAYVSEGMGELQNWDKVMKYQRKNGSLFDSPSTSAAALMHVQNPGCYDYLNFVVEKFSGAVPTIGLLSLYARLSLVDHIGRLGISHHFMDEIQDVLSDSYRSWMQGDEEIFDDPSTCALTFRLLREHGYDVSSDLFKNYFVEEDCYSGSSGGNLKDISDIIELYRASEMIIHEDEYALHEQRIRCKYLMEKVIVGQCASKSLSSPFCLEVQDALKFPCHSTMPQVVNRRFIERYGDKTRILKTSYCSSNFGNNEVLNLAIEDYNQCQLIHREELKEMERWVSENRLDQLKFARQRVAFCYFSSAGVMIAPDLSDSRMSIAKNAMLTTMVDDFFDVGGSLTELKNLIELVEKWDVNISTDCCSEHVQILYAALRSTILEIGHKASILQARNVTSHIIEIWLDLLYSGLREAEQSKDMTFPSMEEYIANGYVSFALGPIILLAVYLVGPKLSEAVVQHSEYRSLYKLVSTIGRLANDIQSFERESGQGKVNAISLCMIHDGMSETNAKAEVKGMIRSARKELLRLVVQKEGSLVPRPCKDLFWNMGRMIQQTYMKNDGFTSNDMTNLGKPIFYEPVSPPPSVKNLN